MIFTKDGASVDKFGWQRATSREDGTFYGPDDHDNYQVGLSDPGNPNDSFTPFVSIPAGYDVEEWYLKDLGISEPGLYEMSLRTVDMKGAVSGWSNAITFKAAHAAPKPPIALQVF